MTESATHPLFDKQDVTTTGVGFAIGIAMIVFFCLLSVVLNQTLLVDHSNIPY